MTITAPEVVAAFSRFTGIALRIMPHAVQRQAADFVAHGFALADLELVVAWTKRQISQKKSGFTEASYTWKRLFGEHGAADEWQVFQERLGLAEAERRRGWRPRLTEGCPAAPKTPEEPRPDPEEEERLRKAAAAAFSAFRQNPTGV